MVWRGDRLDTGRILWVSVTSSALLAVAMAIAGARMAPLLAASILFGFAISPQFPTMLAHLHRSVPLTGAVTAWCIAGSAIGGLVLPWTIGSLIDSVGVSALPWTIAGASAASAGVVYVIDRWALSASDASPAVDVSTATG